MLLENVSIQTKLEVNLHQVKLGWAKITPFYLSRFRVFIEMFALKFICKSLHVHDILHSRLQDEHQSIAVGRETGAH